MTNDKTKKISGATTMAAGLAGAAIGAAAGVALSNKNTRKKIGKVVGGARETGSKLLHQIQKESNNLQKQVKNKTKKT